MTYNLNSGKRPFSHLDEPKRPFRAPPGFSDITYTIKNDLFVPLYRKNQIQPDFSQNYKNQSYIFPIHNPKTPSYNLLCIADKMKVGDHIEVPNIDHYSFAYSQLSLYSARIRADKHARMLFRFRGAYDIAHDLGRIWRIA